MVHVVAQAATTRDVPAWLIVLLVVGCVGFIAYCLVQVISRPVVALPRRSVHLATAALFGLACRWRQARER